MDPRLIHGVVQSTEPLNHKIMKGIATEQLKEPEREIDKILRCASVDFPEGFTYDDYVICSPEEEYRVVTRVRNNRRWYELARSDFYLVKFMFSFYEKELYPRYMYMPALDSSGPYIWIRGKQYAISPVLVDPAFSIGGDSMFIQMTRARFNFDRTTTHYMVNNERETVYVAWSWLHFEAKRRFGRKAKTGRIMYSSLGHYLMSQYGFLGAVRRYANTTIVVGTDSIHPVNYPPSEYHIVQSCGIAPRRLLSESNYTATPIRMAIRKEDYSDEIKVLVASFYYVADNYPDKVTVEDIDDPRLWRMILGYIILPDDLSDGILIRQVRSHLESLDEYLDALVQEDLMKTEVPCVTIYDTFMYVMLTLSSSSTSLDKDINSPWGKRFVTTRYVLYDIVAGINRMVFDLKNMANKKDAIEERDIVSVLNDRMRMADIAKLKHQNRHPEISLVDTSGECSFFDVTSSMVTQDKASSSGGKKAKINLSDPKKHLHSGLLLVNCYNNLPKSDPTGASKINPRVKIHPDGTVVFEEKYIDMLKDLQYRYMR